MVTIPDQGVNPRVGNATIVTFFILTRIPFGVNLFRTPARTLAFAPQADSGRGDDCQCLQPAGMAWLGWRRAIAVTWAVIMIGVSAVLSLAMSFRHRDAIFTGVVIWALVGI
jgi:hypothetical protein